MIQKENIKGQPMRDEMKSKVVKKRFQSINLSLWLLVLAMTATFASGCHRSSADSSDGATHNATKPAPTPQTPFERDLQYVRDGQFAHMYVFARKDGAVMNKEDITYLKDNSPPQTNMWVATEENRRVIAGTNFDFPQENFDALGKRFVVEDYTGK